MSILHILSIIFIGLIIGCLFDVLTLQRVPGGLFSFIFLGMGGAFLSDIILRYCVENRILPHFLCSKPSIVIEQIIGATLILYLFNRIKWDYR